MRARPRASSIAGIPLMPANFSTSVRRPPARSPARRPSTSTEGSFAAMTTAAPSAPVWNLSDLYDTLEDPRIGADVSAARERAEALEAAYTGRIATAELSAETLRAALDEYEAILRL